MSELRWHPFLEQWVITATHRQERTFLPPADFCPLCPTAPGGFPTEIPRPDFDIAVFENRFPSLQPDPPAPAVAATSLSPVLPARGICEVVVYSPRHQDSLGAMPLQRIRNLMAVWRDRYLELGAEASIRCVFIFENRGEEVGVTLHHPHGQIYAFPYLPPVLERELEASRRHRRATGRCPFCQCVEEEQADGRRVVVEGERTLAFIPFFARYPYETWLVPRRHLSSMAEWTPADAGDLALVLKALLLKLDALFQRPFPYILVVHQAPTDGGDHRDFHLHLELYSPLRSASRLKFLAGCESGAGSFINDTLPEERAADLRAVGPASVAELLEAERRPGQG